MTSSEWIPVFKFQKFLAVLIKLKKPYLKARATWQIWGLVRYRPIGGLKPDWVLNIMTNYPLKTSQLLMADCHAYKYIFRQFFSLSKKFTKIIMCLNTAVYKSGKYLYGLFKMFVLGGIDHQLFCYFIHVYNLHFLFRW